MLSYFILFLPATGRLIKVTLFVGLKIIGRKTYCNSNYLEVVKGVAIVVIVLLTDKYLK